MNLEKLTSHSAFDDLRDLVNEAPYIGAYHALLASAAKNEAHPSAERLLKRAAISTYDRAQLHELVFGAEIGVVKKPEESTAPVPEADAAEVANNINVDTPTPATHQETPDSENLAQEQDSDGLSKVDELDRQLLSEAMAAGAAIDLLRESEETEAEPVNELDAGDGMEEDISENADTSEASTKETESTSPATPDRLNLSGWMSILREETALSDQAKIQKIRRDATDLIDHFIANEEAIVPKRAEFFSPSKAAKSSLIDNDEIVSETLAKIYEEQGNLKKAIATYEKLSLRHPEKSAYFAARISKLNKDIKS